MRVFLNTIPYLYKLDFYTSSSLNARVWSICLWIGIGCLNSREVLAAEENSPSTYTEIQLLKQEVQLLQKRILELEAKTVHHSICQEVKIPIKTEQLIVADNIDKTTSVALPKKNGATVQVGPLQLTVGGFIELAAIYRSRNETADIATNFNNGIPFNNAVSGHTSEFRESARQSRLSLMIDGPENLHAHVKAYFEGDLLGAAPTANSLESNSYTPRVRHTYAEYVNKDHGFYFLGGQTWSLLTSEKKGMNPRDENLPLTIDAQYVAGFNWTRSPQLRFVKTLAKDWNIGLSLETPQANINNGTGNPLVATTFQNAGGANFFNGNNYSLDQVPDVIAKTSWDTGWGHYELLGLARRFTSRFNQSNAYINAGGVGANFTLPLINKKLDLIGSVLTGRGIGRYGSAQLPDAVVKPEGGLTSLKSTNMMVGIVGRPNPELQLYGYAGQEQVSQLDESYRATVNGQTSLVPFGYGASGFDNSGCQLEGSSASNCIGHTKKIYEFTLGGWWKFYQGEIGAMSLGLQAGYIKRKAFEGIGGAPSTDQKMMLFSFRYHPFQP